MLNANNFNLPIKINVNHPAWLKNLYPNICYWQQTHPKLRVKDRKLENEQTGVVILISDTVDFKSKLIRGDIIKRNTSSKNITIKRYVLSIRMFNFIKTNT